METVCHTRKSEQSTFGAATQADRVLDTCNLSICPCRTIRMVRRGGRPDRTPIGTLTSSPHAKHHRHELKKDTQSKHSHYHPHIRQVWPTKTKSASSASRASAGTRRPLLSDNAPVSTDMAGKTVTSRSRDNLGASCKQQEQGVRCERSGSIVQHRQTRTWLG